jgi:hypothetical protein
MRLGFGSVPRATANYHRTAERGDRENAADARSRDVPRHTANFISEGLAIRATALYLGAVPKVLR